MAKKQRATNSNWSLFLLRVPSMFDSLRGGSPRSSLMEVKESEAQGRRREAHVC